MAPDPDPLAAELAAIRERTERPVPNATSLPITHRGVRTLMESCADVPRLLAAVEAVLRDHEPRTRIPPNRHYSICRACSRIWPCATVQDITSKLLSKGETGG